MNIKSIKLFSVFLCTFIFLNMLCPVNIQVCAASEPSIRTTLKDKTVQRGSKKTFDVWARNSSGKKISATVKINGQKLAPTWEDNEKASYTLIFSKEGVNKVVVSALSEKGQKKEITYNITYKKAANGECIGYAVWSVEAFTIGCGYIVHPVKMPIYEGETAADQLIRLLHQNGFVGYCGGSTKASFYLGYIADGISKDENFSGYKKSGVPKKVAKLNISPNIPGILMPHLKSTMDFLDPNDYKNNWVGYLGEFVFSNGSGWMYCINNIFPNVGFSDSYLSDGDVVRVQFTLGYGADIGGFGAIGAKIENADKQPKGDYYSVCNKDNLTKEICRAKTAGLLKYQKVKVAYNSAIEEMKKLNASQNAVNAATSALQKSISDLPVEAAAGNTNAAKQNSDISGSKTGKIDQYPAAGSAVSGGTDNSALSCDDVLNDNKSKDSTDLKSNKAPGEKSLDKGKENKVGKFKLPVLGIVLIIIVAAGLIGVVFIAVRFLSVNLKKKNPIKLFRKNR